MNYYNDNDPYCCQWLRNLIAAGLIPKGDVDERSIIEVTPGDIEAYAQCHFFAGIGGWPLALQLAGWPEDRPVWTGSCPCQPFSVAGKRAGVADERHLWPEFSKLVAERKPATVFGEQVAGSDGREWLVGVFADLEELGYAVAGADLCAAGVGAPHIRQRLWWMADNNGWMEHTESEQMGVSGCPWLARETVMCADGKTRPVKPGIQCVANGIQQRASKLRAYGNAIVPQVAAEFIKAAML